MTEKQSLVSIVTLSYNQGRFVEGTIAAGENPDYPNIEHIIADRLSLASPKILSAGIDIFLENLHTKVVGIE